MTQGAFLLGAGSHHSGAGIATSSTSGDTGILGLRNGGRGVDRKCHDQLRMSQGSSFLLTVGSPANLRVSISSKIGDSRWGWRGGFNSVRAVSASKCRAGQSSNLLARAGPSSQIARTLTRFETGSSLRRRMVQSGSYIRVRGRRRSCRVLALWSRRGQVEVRRKDEEIGPLKSIADFTRFREKGADGAELQTAIISYKKPFPWSLVDKQQVDLVAAVHIADKNYFSVLQKELASYDRVLYEMVADKNPRHTNRNVKYRWRPPKRRPGANGGGFSIIGTIQRLMASVLMLDFQLNCMDYRQENWYHADLDHETFQALQQEKGESFFTFARDLTELSSKTIMRNLNRGEGLDPWRSKLLWVSRVFPMPLVGLFLIEVVCSPTNSPLTKSPEMKALLDFDVASALKVFLAKQISSDITDGASSLVENSVIIGERNRVAMNEVHEALREGCTKIAVFYGSGHLPDMDARLRKDFGLKPTEIQWQTAWSIKRRGTIQQDTIGDALSSLAQISGWPLTRYQTMALLFFSAALAVDLYFWELVLGTVNDYAQQTIITVLSLLDRGWDI